MLRHSLFASILLSNSMPSFILLPERGVKVCNSLKWEHLELLLLALINKTIYIHR